MDRGFPSKVGGNMGNVFVILDRPFLAFPVSGHLEDKLCGRHGAGPPRRETAILYLFESGVWYFHSNSWHRQTPKLRIQKIGCGCSQTPIVIWNHFICKIGEPQKAPFPSQTHFRVFLDVLFLQAELDIKALSSKMTEGSASFSGDAFGLRDGGGSPRHGGLGDGRLSDVPAGWQTVWHGYVGRWLPYMLHTRRHLNCFGRRWRAGAHDLPVVRVGEASNPGPAQKPRMTVQHDSHWIADDPDD